MQFISYYLFMFVFEYLDHGCDCERRDTQYCIIQKILVVVPLFLPEGSFSLLMTRKTPLPSHSHWRVRNYRGSRIRWQFLSATGTSGWIVNLIHILSLPPFLLGITRRPIRERVSIWKNFSSEPKREWSQSPWKEAEPFIGALNSFWYAAASLFDNSKNDPHCQMWDIVISGAVSRQTVRTQCRSSCWRFAFIRYAWYIFTRYYNCLRTHLGKNVS